MENKKVLISIIIPHYNRQKMLDRLLTTIPCEDDIQVIVVDDASSKGQDELESLKEKYSNQVEFYGYEINAGAGKARNVGLAHAVGQWLLFADSDDIFTEGAFDLAKKAIEEKKDSDIIYFKPNSVDTNGNVARGHIPYNEYVISYSNDSSRENEVNLRYKFFVPWSKLVKRELVELHNIKFDEVRYSNDIMFSTKIGHYAKKIAAIDNIIYCRIMHDNSLVTKKSFKTKLIRANIHADYKLFLIKHLDKDCKKILELSELKACIAMVQKWICSFLLLFFR